jgi:glutamate transport system substrate-binding protein
MSKIENLLLTRRQALAAGAGTIAAASLFGLAACDSSDTPTSTASSASSSSDTSSASTDLDIDAYDSLIAGGATADDATISANAWAKKIKDAGTFRVGGTRTSTLFSLLNETDNKVRGFDAGLYQLLTRYILGDETKLDLTQVTSDTRESVLQNDQVDAVFATYSITDSRKKVISFAGPYFVSQQAILVLADNTDINSVDDLAGKNVAVQSGSTGPSIVSELVPDAKQQEFSTDEEARQALEQGRVDAYVIDETLQMGSVVKNPGKYRIAGDPFGPEDPYGIGLPLDSDGVDFVNAWLKSIEDDGTWEQLWKIAIGDRTGLDNAPEPPAIEA